MSLGQDFNDIKGGLHPLAEFRNAAQESAATIAFRQQAIEMGMKGDDIVAGVIKTAAAAAKEVQGSIAERAEKQAKERFDDAMFLAVVGDLDAQIAAKQGEIDDLTEQIDAAEELLEIIDRDGDIDPTDPTQMRLLKLLDIPEEDWGTVTRQQITDRLDALRARRDQVITDRNQLIQERHDLAALADESLGRKKEAVNHQLDQNRDEMLAKRPAQIEAEADWFKAEVEHLEAYAASVGLIHEIDKIIDTLADSTKMSFIKDKDFSGLAADRLKIDNFMEQYIDLQEYKEEPDYQQWLEETIQYLDDETIGLLLKYDSTPTEVIKAIQSLSHELEKSFDISNDLN